MIKCLHRFLKKELVCLVYMFGSHASPEQLIISKYLFYTFVSRLLNWRCSRWKYVIIWREQCIKNMHLILESLHLWIALTSAIMINYQLSTIALLLLFTWPSKLCDNDLLQWIVWRERCLAWVLLLIDTGASAANSLQKIAKIGR